MPLPRLGILSSVKSRVSVSERVLPFFEGYKKGSPISQPGRSPKYIHLHHNQVADWLYKCEKTLDFFFNNQPDDITEEEISKAEHEQVC